ncbi:argonaute 5 [Friedmanniomyces endolithicus]|nr:argonaute 5 [Friedmanniomyces endolithicus]
MSRRDKRHTADLSRTGLTVPFSEMDQPQHRRPRRGYGSELNSPDSSISRKPRTARSREETIEAVRIISDVLRVTEDDQDANYGLDTRSDSAAEENRDSAEVFTTREPGENVSTASDFSPQEAKQDIRDPTVLAVNMVYQYDVKILNGGELCKTAKKQILKAFKKRVSQDGAVSQLNRSSFVATRRIPQLEQPLLLHVHLATDAEATIAASRAEYVKVHDRKEDGETVKQWILLGEMMPVPRSSGRTESELKTLATQEHVKAIGKQEGRHWTHTIVIMADRIAETIGRSRLLDHESTVANRSRIAQLINNCMLSQAKSEASFSSGNMHFGEATALNCGLEVREGITVKPGISHADEEVHIMQTECKQHFYQPILLSDFMLAQFGSSVLQCDVSKAEELTSILRVATSKGCKSRTVQTVTHKTVSSLTARCNGKEDLITLDELYEDHYGKRLRYPTMPCINIGLAGRDVFVSAEACQLVADQPFNHKLPFYAGEQIFTLRPETPKICKSKLITGDSPHSPFANVDASKLDVLFAEVVIHPDSSRRSDIDQLCVLNKEHWTGFQNSIKSRFKGVISQSVRKVKNDTPVVLPYPLRQTEAAPSIWAEKLRNTLKMRPAAAESSVVVVAVPAGKHNANIYKLLKKICGIEIGIQCKVIRTDALSKVLKKPVEGTEQRRFAGAIVRNLLARTSHPPALDHRYSNDGEYQLVFPAPDEVSQRGVLFGIHIQSIASSKIRNGTGDREWKTAPGQLVTITSSANWITANVLTTHHLLLAGADNVAADHLSTCLKEHISSSKLIRGEFTHVVLYRSGEGAGRRDQLIVEMNKLVYDHFDSLAGLAMVAYARETVVQVLGDEAVVSSGQRSGLTALERNVATAAADLMHDQGQRKQDRCILDQHLREMTNAFGLDAAFRKVYVRELQEVNNAKCAYLLSHVELDLEGQGQAEQNQAHLGTCYSVLRNTIVPDILHLAQQASKYIQRFVEEVPSGERLATGEQVMKFELQDVMPELRKTLYYV